MPRTCSTCQVTHHDEQSRHRFCSNCGSPLPPSAASGATTDTDYPYSIDSDSSSGSTAVDEDFPPLSSTGLSSDERDLSLLYQSKSPALAALLSFLLVGMGQVYLGQVEKGLTMLAATLLLLTTVAIGPLGFVILLFNVLDAFLLAKKIKGGKPLMKWEFFFSRIKNGSIN